MLSEKKHRIAVVGCGNVGRFTAQAILASEDLELAGIVRRPENVCAQVPPELAGIPVVSSIESLDNVDVACLAVPTRQVPKYAQYILSLGINTVDSYDIHKELVSVKNTLDRVARQAGSVAVVSAGWDPGTDSLIRVILEIMAPFGITHTNFGPGMSMGHTTAVRAVPGVKDAISITQPKGSGVHRRMVYVELDEGTDFDTVREAIVTDPYFRNDETVVMRTGNVSNLRDVGHGVLIERKGTSGMSCNQRFKFEMSINNPALTGQIMVGAARASLKQSPGAYTLPELPLIDFLPGDRDSLLARLV
ncbi:MAG TPA: diaminopimelate dehydrogenase [Firmicutes bacterium]|nr:diaminopimelate dehydrogenase [Bacillota bacterium]